MTPNGARTLIGSIRTLIGELRTENTRVRADLATRFPNLNVTELVPPIAADATETLNVSGENDCPDLNQLIHNLFDRALDLAEQNGALGRIQPLPPATPPHVIRALIQIHHISYLTARPYTTANTGNRLDNVPAGVRSSAPVTVEELHSRVEAAIAAAPNRILPPADRRTHFSGVYSPEVVEGNSRYVSCDTLDNVVEALNSESFRGYHVLVVGHTDHGGPADYNGRLSNRRADVAGLYLTAGGVQSDRIATTGVGESEPVYQHDLPQDRPHPTAEDRPNMMTRAEATVLRQLGVRGRDLTALVAGRAVTNRALDIFLYRPEEIADANNHTGDNDYIRSVLARIQPANGGRNAAQSPPTPGSHTTVYPDGGDAGAPDSARPAQ